MHYNNFNPYQQRLQQMEQSFGQPIQTIQQSQPQAVCYFVSSKSDMQNIQVQPNVFYIGINRQAKEIYIKSLNNDGLIDFDTYTLSDGTQESTDLKMILDKLDLIIKEKKDDEHNSTINATSIAGTVSEQSNNGSIQPNDVR